MMQTWRHILLYGFISTTTFFTLAYQNCGAHSSVWKPQITHVEHDLEPDHSYTIQGILFDTEAKEKAFPLIRITNYESKDSIYCNLYDYNLLDPDTSDQYYFASFAIPSDIQAGHSFIDIVSDSQISESFSVIVNSSLTPKLTLTPNAQTIPDGGTTYIQFSSSIPGTTYSWPNPKQTNVSGGKSGSGSTLEQTLNLTYYRAGKPSYMMITYAVTPVANGVQGEPVLLSISLDP